MEQWAAAEFAPGEVDPWEAQRRAMNEYERTEREAGRAKSYAPLEFKVHESAWDALIEKEKSGVPLTDGEKRTKRVLEAALKRLERMPGTGTGSTSSSGSGRVAAPAPVTTPAIKALQQFDNAPPTISEQRYNMVSMAREESNAKLVEMANRGATPSDPNFREEFKNRTALDMELKTMNVADRGKQRAELIQKMAPKNRVERD